MDEEKVKLFTQQIEQIKPGDHKDELLLALMNYTSKITNEIQVTSLKNAREMAIMSIITNTGGVQQ